MPATHNEAAVKKERKDKKDSYSVVQTTLELTLKVKGSED